MNIDIIIVHFGDITTTLKAVKSLEDNVTYRNIIVVNNDQNITIQDFLKKKNLIGIDSGKNVGFAAGVNKGIKQAIKNKADYIVLFNNDALAINDFTSVLVNSFKHHENIGIVAPVVKFEQDGKTVYDTGGVIQKGSGRTYHNNLDKIPKIPLISADYVSGCCIMITSELFKNIGYFDERFFLYYEDVDLCLRAKRSGYSILCNTEAIINHKLSYTIKKNSDVAQYYLIQSGRKFGSKYSHKFPLHTLFMMYQSFIFFIRSPLTLGSIIKGWV